MRLRVAWAACLFLLAGGAAAAAGASLVVNGSMTQGGAEPAGWPVQNARVVRDTSDFRVGPASLRLEPISGAVSDGKVTQALAGVAGKTITVSGYVKSTGADVSNAGLAILVQGADWKQLQWEGIVPAQVIIQSTGWTPFSKTVAISPDAANVMLIYFYSGTGKVWLDEVEASLPGSGPPPALPAGVVASFTSGFAFAYGDFADNAKVEDGAAHITSAGSRGGGGVIPPVPDLSSFADESPALRVKVAEGNTATVILAFFADAAGAKFTYTYPLEGLPVGQWQLVLPKGGASLKVPNSGWLPGQTPLNLAAVSSIQVQGDYGGKVLNVFVDHIEMVKPTPQMAEDRQKLMSDLEKQAESQRQEIERLERAKQEALRNSPHLPDGPQVVGVCAVAPDVLCVTIQSQQVRKAPQVPYEPQPGDVVEGSGGELLVHEHGQIRVGKTQLTVFRTVNGRRVSLGSLAINAGMLRPPETLLGQPLGEITLQEPAAYSISSGDDPAYAQAVPPLKVDRKSRPNDLDVGGHYPTRHWLYLKLPHPLQEGKTYTVSFTGINTRETQVSYTHDTTKAQTEAIHVTQVGYRPSDPFKRAYVSTWLGTGGALACDATSFGLLDDATGKQVHEGKLTFAFGPDKPERLDKEKNYSQTNVYYADFSGFRQPGAYRVRVPGLGVSAPFRIAEDVWADAFRVSMKGMLHQRSGIALGPPLTSYVRPRPMFPGDDDVKAYQLDMLGWEGEGAVNGAFERLLGPDLDASKLKTDPNAWGGYMDAGDWDRVSGHMRTGYLLLELLDLFPDHFEKVKLALPPDEASDNVPDLLNEALWGIDVYRRLQRPDGSVCGGINSTGEPRSGETSWEDSELLGVYAPDPESTYHYAACAAKAARNLARYDRARSDTFRESAVRAWKWADANGEEMAAQHKREAPVLRMRALAAAELYHLTGDRAYNEAFRAAMQASKAPFDADRDPWFSYALLPDELADKDLKQKAIDGYRMLGDTAIKFSQGNAFNIATDVPLLPMIAFVGYWSTPGMSLGPGLPRAYYLTGDERYLSAAVASCNFSVGANPMNMTLTTGVGRDYPRAPLHVDSRHSGQEAPSGLTVYGPFDPSLTGPMYDWAHTWILRTTMAPGAPTWPPEEFYVDVYKWPPMNEYTVPQTIAVTAYTWGYLAARK